MKIFPILGIAAIAIGASSSLAQAAKRPPQSITTGPGPALPSPTIVENPGFETGNFTGYSVFDQSFQSFVDDFKPHTGNYAADLGAVDITNTGQRVGILSQTLQNTNVGTNYLLSYYLANNDSQGQNSFATIVNGVTASVATLPFQDYTLYTVPFTAQATNTIEFTYYNNNDYFYLDDISVVPAPNSVPEPSGSLSALAFGALGISYLLKRQHKSRNNLN